MADYKFDFDTGSGSPYTEGEILTFSGGGTAELVLLYSADDIVGEMYFAMISGTVPANDETITGGTSGETVGAVNGTPFLSRFPLKIRDDLQFTAVSGDIRLNAGAPLLGTTHSFDFDTGAGGAFVATDIVTFGTSGSTAEVVDISGTTTGTLYVRMISVTEPVDNETITSGGKTAAVNGAVHVRCYTPNNIHYWFSDKGDDQTYIGDDQQDRTKPRVSRRVGVTDVTLLGDANIDDALSYKVYGGSIVQGGGSGEEYNAVTIAVVDVDGATQPVIIQNAALLSTTTTEYWKNGYMPNAASTVNMVVKVKDAGTVIDRRVVRFRALEVFRQYFTAPDPTLSGGITPVSLVATDDGNDNTDASAFNATATYGYTTLDHNEGSGAQPFWMVVSDNGDTKTQVHQRFKWEQRRGTSETILGLNAQLIVGNDLTFAFDTETGTDIAAGDVLTFSGNSVGTALVLAINYDDAVSGTLYCQRLTGSVPADGAVVTSDGTGTAVINGTPTDRLIINNLMGTYTGSAFNPANIGISLAVLDADENDLFTDLDGDQIAPPTNRSGSISTSVGNTITAYPWDGSAVDAVGDQEPDFDRLQNNALVNTTVTTITVDGTPPIPTWMPKTGGFIRITRTSGARTLHAVTDWTGNVFTIASTDFSGDTIAAGAGIMPAPIDEVAVSGVTSFSGVYTADQDGDETGDQQFVVRVSNGSAATPKQPSTSVAAFGSGGFSLNVSLQDD